MGHNLNPAAAVVGNTYRNVRAKPLNAVIMTVIQIDGKTLQVFSIRMNDRFGQIELPAKAFKNEKSEPQTARLCFGLFDVRVWNQTNNVVH